MTLHFSMLSFISHLFVHSTIIADEGGRLTHIPEAIFAYLKRNAVQEERRYQVPADQVMEIGEQISL